MTITQKYVDFILNNIIQDTTTVQLYKPQESGSRMFVKLGPEVRCKVQIEVIEKYTRSAKLKLTFDRYEIEDIFFIPFSSSPESIEMKTCKKIEKIVNNTFINDNRTEDIKQMYTDKYQNFGLSLSNFISEKMNNQNYASIKHLPHLGLLNFEGDLFRAYDLLDGNFLIVNEKHEDVITTNAYGILDYMEGAGKPIVNYDGRVWIIQEQHENARPTQESLYKFLKLDLLIIDK